MIHGMIEWGDKVLMWSGLVINRYLYIPMTNNSMIAKYFLAAGSRRGNNRNLGQDKIFWNILECGSMDKEHCDKLDWFGCKWSAGDNTCTGWVSSYTAVLQQYVMLVWKI